MRTFSLIVTLFISTSTLGQSTLDKQLSATFCDCFSSIQSRSVNDVTNCFFKACQTNQDSLFTAIKSQYGGISKETINRFSQNLLSRMCVSLINDCDAYYKFMDTVRNSIYRYINKDSIRNSIQIFNKKNFEHRDTSFFIKRGVMYFEISDLNNALVNFNSALKLDSSSIIANDYKAWVLERTGNYSEAYDIYNKLTVLSSKVIYKILAAILNRKKEGL